MNTLSSPHTFSSGFYDNEDTFFFTHYFRFSMNIVFKTYFSGLYESNTFFYFIGGGDVYSEAVRGKSP